MKNTINNPLILRDTKDGYKVNKPLDQSGEYVDKDIADELLGALLQIIKCDETFLETPMVANAINKATE